MVSSHGIGVAEAVSLARLLGSLPDVVEVWAIEGVAFCTGDPVTGAVQAQIDAVVAALPAHVSRVS